MILFTIICMLLLMLAGYLGFELYKAKNIIKEYSGALEEGQKAVDLALQYEEFYSLTVGDIGEIVDSLRELVGRRQMLSDDSDVQNLVRLLAIAHDTLLGYINAKLPEESQQERPTTDKAN